MLNKLKGYLKNKNIWFGVGFRIIELAAFYMAAKMFLKIGTNYVEQNATPHTIDFFHKAAAAGETVDGTIFLVFYFCVILSVLILPILYGILWLHRIDKWIALESLKKKFKREKEIPVLDKPNLGLNGS